MNKIIVTDRVRRYLNFELFPEARDIEIVTAFSNEEALTLHKKKNVDLIITELYGSGMNALQFCSLLREAPDLRRVSVIVCCRSNEVEIRESERCRANAVVTLPVGPDLLRNTMHQLLSIPARGDYRIHFSARCARYSLHDPFDCEITNISVTGMLIEAAVDLHRGDRINCSLVLPPAASFEMQLDVVRAVKSKACDRNRYGVRFSHLDPAARRRIESLVEKNPHN